MFTQSTVLNSIIGFIIQIIWMNLADLSFLVINSMISISIPGLPSKIHSVMIKFIYFDILYSELWISPFMNTIGLHFYQVTNDTALNF
jgi:hypothetical protein